MGSSSGGGEIRITHVGVEVLRDGDPDVRITHVGAEVLRSEGNPSLRGRFFLVF